MPLLVVELLLQESSGIHPSDVCVKRPDAADIQRSSHSRLPAKDGNRGGNGSSINFDTKIPDFFVVCAHTSRPIPVVCRPNNVRVAQ